MSTKKRKGSIRLPIMQQGDARLPKPAVYPTDLPLAPLEPEMAEAVIKSRKLPHKIFDPTKDFKAEKNPSGSPRLSNTVQGPASITELARSLKNDPHLIYEWVANNIQYYPIYGVQKGAFGALLDGQGTSFDISMLLVELLRAAGITANYMVGQIQLTGAQAANWLDIAITPHDAAAYILYAGQVPYTWTVNAQNELATLTLSHCWVKWQNPSDSQWYMFDPSFKQYTYKSAINLTTAMGYNQTTFLSDALSGATYQNNPDDFVVDYVENLNRGNIRSNMTSLSTSLLQWIKQNDHDACFDDIVGGRSIIPASIPLLQATLSHQKPGNVPTEYTEIPLSYKIICTLSMYPVNLDPIEVTTFTSDQIYGKALTLWVTDGGYGAELRLDDALIWTYSSETDRLSNFTIGGWEVTHNAYVITTYNTGGGLVPYYNTGFEGTGYILLNTTFGSAGRGLVDYHRKKWHSNYAAGIAEDEEVTLGEALAAAGAAGNAQFSRITNIVGRLTNTSTIFHHGFSTICYALGSGGYTFITDYRSMAYYVTHGSHDDTIRKTAFQLAGLVGFEQSEHLNFSEVFDLDGAGAARMNDVAVSQGAKLSGTTFDVSGLRSVQTDPPGWDYGYKDLTGHGYQEFRSTGSYSAYITAYKGGVVAEEVTTLIPPYHGDECAPGGGGLCCPKDTYTDFSTGSGDFPYSLPFKRRYSACHKTEDGPLGLGWGHNFDKTANVYTDVMQALGEDSPIDAVGTIAAIYVILDLFSHPEQPHRKPFERYVMADCVIAWWLEQVFKNAVAMELGERTEIFIKLPDGSYNPPQDSNATLTRDGLGIFSYKTPQGVTLTFDAQNRLATWAFPAGPVVTLAYSGSLLQSVSNGMGRQLNFVYNGNYLSQVNDGTGRAISFAVNTSTQQLDTYTNAASKVFSYVYDQPGRLQKIFAPNSATTPILTRTYDTLGRVMSEKNSNNQETTFFCANSRSEEVDPAGIALIKKYDSRGNVTKITNSLGAFSLFEYDCLSRLVKKTLPEGNFFEYVYDTKGNLLNVTATPKPGSPLSPLTASFTYEAPWNKVKTMTDPLGRVTTFNYDPANGNLLSIVYPLVDAATPTVSFTYNSRGQVLTRTEQTGIVTKWNYDTGTEKLLSVVHDFGTGRLNLTTSFGYDSAGNVNAVTDPRGKTATALFDAERRLKEATTPTPFSYLSKLTWDDNSNLTKTEQQTGDVLNPWQTAQYAYTPTDKLQTITSPSSNVTTLSYDGVDRLWKATDAAMQTVEFAYDDLNRLSTIKDASTAIVETRTYTPNGLIATIKDANNNITTYQYDGFDRLDKAVYPDASYEQNTYDANSNLLTFRTRSGNTVTSTYDTHNRLKTQTPSGLATRTFTYDLAGRRTKTNTPVIAGNPTTGDYEYFYDTAGRFYKERNPDGKEVTYQLDASGNITRLIWPDGYFADYIYDELNRVTDIKLNGNLTAAAHFDYDPLSRRKKITYQNGCTTDYGYEIDDAMNSLVQSFVGSAVTFTGLSSVVNRLASISVSDSQFFWNPVTDFAIPYGVANNLNQYPTVKGTSYSYNTDGCLVGDGIWTYGYDSLNRLISANAGSTSLSFLYDPDSRQSQKQVGSSKTRFIYDGEQRIADYDGVLGTLQTRYVYGTDIDEPLIEVSSAGTLSFFHHDRLGSIIAKTNSSGAVLNRYNYGPFGETTSLTGTTFGFTGQRYDTETGLYYYKARYYSPALGRFLQPDPIGYTDALNLYEYVKNDPVNYTDTLGLGSLVEFSPSAAGYSGLPGNPAMGVQQYKGNVKHDEDKDDCKRRKDKNLEETPLPGTPYAGPLGGGGGPAGPSGGPNPYLEEAHAMEDEFRKKVALHILAEIAVNFYPPARFAKGAKIVRTLGAGKEFKSTIPILLVRESKMPHTAANILHAQKAGWAKTLTYGGKGYGKANRNLKGIPKIQPNWRDEYPFASTLQGNKDPWIGHVPKAEQLLQGRDMAKLYKNMEAGGKFLVQVVRK